MSKNITESKIENKFVTAFRKLETGQSQSKTIQTQGGQAIQVGYTPDVVTTITLAPTTGLIGTFLCTLQYDDPQPESVVFGELDIAVNKDVDTFDPANTLSAYYGGLHTEVINDLYLEQMFYNEYGYHPIVKVVRLTTFSSPTSATFYIHSRWRYVGVGNTLQPVTGDMSILPG